MNPAWFYFSDPTSIYPAAETSAETGGVEAELSETGSGSHEDEGQLGTPPAFQLFQPFPLLFSCFVHSVVLFFLVPEHL